MVAGSNVGVIIVMLVLACVGLIAAGFFVLFIRLVLGIFGKVLEALFGSPHKPVPPKRIDPRRRRPVEAEQYASPPRGMRICRNASCGNQNPTYARYCGRCGGKL